MPGASHSVTLNSSISWPIISPTLLISSTSQLCARSVPTGIAVQKAVDRYKLARIIILNKGIALCQQTIEFFALVDSTIGNIYAMLGAWLSARSRGDDMLLRIEDIDEPRVVPGAAELMMDDLHWLGLDWDGDPVFQSARHDLYREALHCLENLTIDDAYDSPFDERNDHTPAVGSAANNAIAGTTPLIYPCFCSRADIRAASAPQEGDRFMVYPGTCRRLIASNPDTVRRRLANGDRHSLRIAMPADTNPHATVQFDDAVFGHQEFNLAHDVGDTIVRRADGLFSYQLVVVVDDLDMGVDDIVRGRDLLRSNALQIAIRQALRIRQLLQRFSCLSRTL